jgi:hypothetical protein
MLQRVMPARAARGFAGVPLVTGVKYGSFRAQGLELELAVFGGGRTSQAMIAGAVAPAGLWS